MVEIAVVAVVAFVASGLTLYSGFGLGTLLLPVFALFLPPSAAVAATAVVHLLNNLFKAGLVGRATHWPTALRLGLPAIPAAVAGAWALGALGAAPAFAWSLAGRDFSPSWAAVAIGALLVLFALLELQPWFQKLAAPRSWLPLGGLLSGFFGGLAGQQGALRSMFLLKSGLSPAAFIATGVVIALAVDLARLPTYAAVLAEGGGQLGDRELRLMAAGVAAAFVGAWLGARHVEKTTIGALRRVVAALMVVVGAGMAAGVVGG